MASKTIDHMDFYVAIAGYQLPSVPDQTFNSLRVSVGYSKGSGFYASFHPGWGGENCWGCVFDFSKDPLSAGMTVDVVPAEKNNAKRIAEMTESLKMAKDVIAALFDDREWQKLKGVLQNVARFGYTEKFKEQAEKYLAERVSKRYEKAVKPIESETKPQISNLKIQKNTTMAQSVKAADLIGKTIVVGDNQATIVIKSVDGDKLSGEFTKDGKATSMSFPVSQLHGMTEKGLWRIAEESRGSESGGQVRDSMQNQATCPCDSVTTEADVQEVQDIVPVVTPKAKDNNQEPRAVNREPLTNNKPKAKVEPIGEHGTLVVGGVPKPGESTDKPKAKTQPSAIKPQPSAIKHQTSGKYSYSTYTTKKGKTGAKITGVSETDAAYQQAAAIHASGSYERDKDGNKHFYLCFGPRYAEAAKKVCELLNAGKPIEDAIAVANAATEERAVKKEEGRRKREEYKAQAESTPKAKGYSSEDVAEMLRKVLAGGDVPEDIKVLLAKAA